MAERRLIAVSVPTRVLLLAIAMLILAEGPARADTETVWPRGGAYHLAAAGNARGDAVVVFRDRSGALNTAFASGGGRFGRPRRVPGSRVGEDPGGVELAVDARGNAVIAWTSEDGSYEADPLSRDESCCYRVRAFVRRRSGRVTRVRTISRSGDSAGLVAVDAAGGRFGVVWGKYESVPSGHLAVGGTSGRFAQRRRLPGRVEPVGLALSARRVLAHGVRGGSRRRAKLMTFRYSGRRLGRPRRGSVRGTRAIGSLFPFASTVRGDILGLQFSDSARSMRIVTGGRGGRARRVRGAYDRLALAASGRGIVARALGRSVVVRRRFPDGTLSRPRRHRAPRSARVAGAEVNRAGSYAVVYRVSARRLIGVLIDGSRRTVTRRGIVSAYNSVTIDARGRTRVVYRSRGRVRAWRGDA